MKVTVKLFATLRKNNLKQQQVEIAENYRIEDIMDEIKITPDKVAIIMVNGRRTGLDHILKSGDIVSLFPAVGGG
jgi:sulfur carrier protein ThiS